MKITIRFLNSANILNYKLDKEGDPQEILRDILGDLEEFIYSSTRGACAEIEITEE